MRSDFIISSMNNQGLYSYNKLTKTMRAKPTFSLFWPHRIPALSFESHSIHAIKILPFRGNFQLKPCQLIGTGSRLRGKRTVQAGLVSKLWLRKGMRQIGYVPTWRGKAVIGQTRLYCSKGEGFRLVEVPTEQAANEAKRLNNQG